MILTQLNKVHNMAQAIVTKFYGATNTRGARIKVTSWQGSKFYSYDYSASCPHKAAFEQWLEDKNAQMAKDYGTEAPAVGWFKLVAEGNSPDGTGNTYIIE